jgi:hypothetical protein
MGKEPSFIVGATVKLRAEFRVDDVLTNPTAVTLTVEAPDGTDSTPAVSADSTGKKSGTFTPAQTGYHNWRWDSTGTAAGRVEGRFYVSTSAIVND